MSNVDHSGQLPTVLSLCTGYGGIERGLELAGLEHRVVAHVEIEAFAAANLVAKMEAGHLVPAPVWTDLKTLPAHCFRDRVDVLTGGYPCQPFSYAGKRQGKHDSDGRHLWPYIHDHIRTIRPVRCFFENVEGHISLGLRDVIADLESLGYATTWGVFSAAEVGAPHQRKRVYILAYASSAGRQQVTRGSHGDEAAHEGRASIQSHIAAGDGEGRGAGAMADATSAGSSPGKRANFQKDAKEKAAEIQPEPKRFGIDVAHTNSARQQPSEWQSRSPEARHNAGRGGEAVADTDNQRIPAKKYDSEKRQKDHSDRRAFNRSSRFSEDVPNANFQRLQGRVQRGRADEEGRQEQKVRPSAKRGDQWPRHGRGSGSPVSGLGRGFDGPATWLDGSWEVGVERVTSSQNHRVDRLRLLGNGVVPHTAAKAWIVLNDQLIKAMRE